MMTVERYIFQSPYANQVQIGSPDPSVKQEDQSVSNTLESNTSTNETLQEAQTFNNSQQSEVEPTIRPDALLDVYA